MLSKRSLFQCNIFRNINRKCFTKQYLKKMEAWQIHEYNSKVQLTDARIPVISSPNDILVKVEAASVNPLDVAMLSGYGNQLVGLIRQTQDNVQFPLTFGRDFSGKVLARGFSKNSLKFSPGEQVWGVVPVQRQGSHAETVLVPNTSLTKQPSNISSIEAVSLMYAGVTAWSALWIFGGLFFESAQGKRVLVLGASGGVGSIAVQLLKAENAFVYATCSSEAIPFVQTLGTDEIFSYNDPDYLHNVRQNGPYDIILDCAGLGPNIYINNNWKCKSFVTLSSPILKNTDQYGIIAGLATSAAQFILPNIQALSRGGTVRWAYFLPIPQAVKHITELVKRGKLKSVTSEVFGFNQLPQAYDRVLKGHLRGKVVIDMMKKNDTGNKEQTV